MNDTQAGRDRWEELKELMEIYPEVPWAQAARLIRELDSYRQAELLDIETEEEMERRGL